MTDREQVPEGIHRWRYNETAVRRGLTRQLKTPTDALAHPYFSALLVDGGGGGGGGGSGRHAPHPLSPL
jgi:hypothetical protein